MRESSANLVRFGAGMKQNEAPAIEDGAELRVLAALNPTLEAPAEIAARLKLQMKSSVRLAPVTWPHYGKQGHIVQDKRSSVAGLRGMMPKTTSGFVLPV